MSITVFKNHTVFIPCLKLTVFIPVSKYDSVAYMRSPLVLNITSSLNQPHCPIYFVSLCSLKSKKRLQGRQSHRLLPVEGVHDLQPRHLFLGLGQPLEDSTGDVQQFLRRGQLQAPLLQLLHQLLVLLHQGVAW